MDPIRSSVPGRLRIRCEDLRAPECLRDLEGWIAGLPGVDATRANPVSGSLVVEYDPQLLSRTELEERVRAHFEEPSIGDFAQDSAVDAEDEEPVLRVRRFNERKVNQVAKIAGMATLGVSMVAAAAGRKRLHIVTGGMFLGCLAAHLVVHRRRLWK